MPGQIFVDTIAGLTRKLGAEIEARAADAIARRGRFAVAVPGGSVATTFFAGLASCRVDWSRTHFFQVDERAVPRDDLASNFSLASKRWFEPAGVPPANVHRMRGDDRDLIRAARDAAADLVSIVGDPPRLDVILLGVGEDGHVASIFPGRAAAGSGNRFVTVVHDAPKPPPIRLTLSMAVLAAADCVVVAALGAAKAAAIREALGQRDLSVPAAEVVARARWVLAFLDREAAGLLAGDLKGFDLSR